MQPRRQSSNVLGGVRLIALNTLREALRQRLTHFIGLIAVALVLGGGFLRDFNFGASELRFIADFGFGALAFFGGALAITATAQLFFNEIEHRTLLTLMAKPVSRSAFIFGKFAGVAAVSALFCGALTAVLAATLWWRESELMRAFPDAFAAGRTVDYAALAGAGFAQWLKLAVLSAFTLLVASFAQTQLFAVVTGFLVFVICHLQFLAHAAAARGGPTLTNVVMRGVACLFPNFQVFDFSEAVAAGGGLVWAELARATVYGGGYALAVSGLAAISFRAREL